MAIRDLVSNIHYLVISFYVGSALEESAIREAYLEKTGNIKHIIKRVPFLTDEDEGRVIKLIEG